MGRVMSDDYRDALAAAHARIEELERENHALRRRVDGQPATRADLEIVRIEQQLATLDLEWRRRARRIGGLPDARADRMQRNVLYALASVFVVVALVTGIASARGPRSASSSAGSRRSSPSSA